MRSYAFLLGGGGATTTTTTTTLKAARLSPPITLRKAKSASHVLTMASVATITTPNGSEHNESDQPNTLPDPRAPSPAPRSDSNNDLSNEVSMLSTKLINAINHSTTLDDNLQHSRHDLEAARKRIAQLETEAKEHADALTEGVLVKRAEVDATMAQLRAELAEAKRERESADKGRKQMEVEVENLTSALFEEANTVCYKITKAARASTH